jgi:cytochrome c oxidase subunit 2
MFLEIRARLDMIRSLAKAGPQEYVSSELIAIESGAKPMQSRVRTKGSAATAALLSLLIVIMVVVTVYVFVANLYPAPPPITANGELIDEQYNLTLYMTGVVFILSQIGLAYAIFRFRDKGQRAQFSRGNNTLEMLWTSATIIVFLGVGILGRKAWAQTRFEAASPDAIKVEVTENQFVFNFRYPGPDGKFGRLSPRLVSASSGNPLGLDLADPAAKDDIVVPTLTVPVNHEVELELRSQDVIHNFYVRELRLQQDAVPGIEIPIHFTATKIGQYEIVCTQLCGLGHYRMHSVLSAMSEADFEKWMKDQAAANQ